MKMEEKGGKMTHKASAAIIILIITILFSLVSGAGIFYLYKKERTKSLELEARLEEINTKQRVTETKLKESERLISDLQFKLEDAKVQTDRLNTELQEEKAAKVEALGQIEQLRVDLERQKELRSDLEKKVSQAQDDVRKTMTQLKDIGSEKKELEGRIKELEMKSPDVELGKIVVGPEESVSGPKVQSLEGKILVLNKDYNFAVINLGAKDAVSLGDIFSIYHNNKYIGDVKVEKVHDSMSAAGFVSSDTRDNVSEGDKVVQKVK